MLMLKKKNDPIETGYMKLDLFWSAQTKLSLSMKCRVQLHW